MTPPAPTPPVLVAEGLIVDFGACVQHEEGLTDAEVLGLFADEPETFAPLIPEIVSYSLAHCPYEQ